MTMLKLLQAMTKMMAVTSEEGEDKGASRTASVL